MFDSYEFRQEEVWKPVTLPNPKEKKYEVSSHGRVKVVATGRILAINRKSIGGCTVKLTYTTTAPPCIFHGKYQSVRSVSRMVAEAFVPNPDGLPLLAFIDGNKMNCRADNLRWSDYRRGSIAQVRYDDEKLRQAAVEKDDNAFWDSLTAHEQKARYERHLAEGSPVSAWPKWRVFKPDDGMPAPVPPLQQPLPRKSEDAQEQTQAEINAARIAARIEEIKLKAGRPLTTDELFDTLAELERPASTQPLE